MAIKVLRATPTHETPWLKLPAGIYTVDNIANISVLYLSNGEKPLGKKIANINSLAIFVEDPESCSPKPHHLPLVSSLSRSSPATVFFSPATFASKGIIKMAHTFVSLLNDGAYNDLEEISYSPTPPLSHEQIQQAPSKPKKGRSKNFLIEEDMLLISGWLNISMDPVQGNNQTQTTYWNRICNYFHENKTFPSDRTPTSLCNRWSAINTSVSKFIGFYNQISGRNQSGVTEQDKVIQPTTVL